MVEALTKSNKRCFQPENYAYSYEAASVKYNYHLHTLRRNNNFLHYIVDWSFYLYLHKYCLLNTI